MDCKKLPKELRDDFSTLNIFMRLKKMKFFLKQLFYSSRAKVIRICCKTLKDFLAQNRLFFGAIFFSLSKASDPNIETKKSNALIECFFLLFLHLVKEREKKCSLSSYRNKNVKDRVGRRHGIIEMVIILLLFDFYRFLNEDEKQSRKNWISWQLICFYCSYYFCCCL